VIYLITGACHRADRLWSCHSDHHRDSLHEHALHICRWAMV